MHLGLPNWHYSFTQVGLDPQSLQWFRFLSPERLQIDIENRRSIEELAKKKSFSGAAAGRVALTGNLGNGFINDKIKLEGLKRKKRRMKLKAKHGTNDQVIEKFTA